MRYKIWLSSVTGEGILGEGKLRLLKEIETQGSLSAAAKIMGMSYRKAWGDIKKAEEMLGYDLTIKQRGGEKGGKSLLTDKAKKLLEAYDALHKKFDKSIEEAFDEFKKTIE